MTSERSALERLVAPLDPPAFLDEFWEQRPAHIPGGARAGDKIGLFAFDGAAFRKAAARITEYSERPDFGMPGLTAYHAGPDGSRSERITAAQIDFCYGAGISVSLAGAQFLDGHLAALASRLRDDLGHPGNVHMHAFLSPDKHGAAMHFDRSSLIVVQLEGAKRWRFSRTPCMDTPPDQTSWAGRRAFHKMYPWAKLQAPEPAAMQELVLRPGDALYLPAGTWHEVASETHSLAVTIGFDRAPIHTVVARHLERLLLERAAWRRTPPPLGAGGNDTSTLEHFTAACADRLVDLRDLIADLTPEDLVAACYPDVVSLEETEPPVEEATSAATEPAEPALQTRQRLVVPRPLRWSPGADAAGTHVLLLASAYGTVSLGLEAFAFVERLTQLSSFTAGEAIDWLRSAEEEPPWERVAGLLQGLIDNGLLRREAS